MPESEEDRVFLEKILKDLRSYDPGTPKTDWSAVLSCGVISLLTLAFWAVVIAIAIGMASRP